MMSVTRTWMEMGLCERTAAETGRSSLITCPHLVSLEPNVEKEPFCPQEQPMCGHRPEQELRFQTLVW